MATIKDREHRLRLEATKGVSYNPSQLELKNEIRKHIKTNTQHQDVWGRAFNRLNEKDQDKLITWVKFTKNTKFKNETFKMIIEEPNLFFKFPKKVKNELSNYLLNYYKNQI